MGDFVDTAWWYTDITRQTFLADVHRRKEILMKEFTGMSDSHIRSDLKEKRKILMWMVKNKIKTVDAVGKIVAEYYQDSKKTMKIIRRRDSKATDLVPEHYLKPVAK